MKHDSHMQGQAAEEVDRCSVILALRNEAYNALMDKHQALQEDLRVSQRELRVRGAWLIRALHQLTYMYHTFHVARLLHLWGGVCWVSACACRHAFIGGPPDKKLHCADCPAKPSTQLLACPPVAC